MLQKLHIEIPILSYTFLDELKLTPKTHLKGLEHCPGRTDIMNQLSLRNIQLKFETSEELHIVLKESIEYTINE